MTTGLTRIDYLGGMPTATPKAVTVSEKPVEMLRADLENENNTVIAYRETMTSAPTMAMASSISAIAKSGIFIDCVSVRRA